MRSSARYLLLLPLLFLASLSTGVKGQVLLGNSGGLSVPSAEMEAPGTFRTGAQFVESGIIKGSQKWGSYDFWYDTYIYYFNFTPFNWIELTFSETLLADNYETGEDSEFYNQDRTVSVKIRPLKEGHYWPAIALGAIDPYSICSHPTYSSLWAAATKHVHTSFLHSTFAFNAGYARGTDGGRQFDGAFGSFSWQPDFLPQARCCVEYDTHGWVLGAEALLWRHLGVYAYARDLDLMSFGLRYQTTIR